MSGKLDFDAGGDFSADPMEAIEAAMSQPTPEPAPQEPQGGTAPEPTPTEPEPAPTSWADPDPDAEPTEPASSGAPTPGSVLEIKGADGKVKQLTLDPTNEELTRLVGKGTAADRWRNERDQARRELKSLQAAQAEVSDLKKQASVWSELEELRSLGHNEAVAKATLGEEGYNKLVEEIREGIRVADGGDPDERYAFDERRNAKERELNDYRRTKREQELEAKLEALEERGHLARFKASASTALQRHDFNQYVEDAHIADSLNEKTWELAASDLQKYAEARDLSPDQITDQMIRKAVAKNAKLIRGGRIQIAESRTDAIIKQKKQDALKQAQITATERYPSGPKSTTDALAGWNGRDAKDLLKRLVKGSK